MQQSLTGFPTAAPSATEPVPAPTTAAPTRKSYGDLQDEIRELRNKLAQYEIFGSPIEIQIKLDQADAMRYLTERAAQVFGLTITKESSKLGA